MTGIHLKWTLHSRKSKKCIKSMEKNRQDLRKILIKLKKKSEFYSVSDLPIGSTGSRLGPQNLGGLRPRFIIFLSLLLDFHNYLSLCTVLSKQPFINFPYTVALHLRILRNFKQPSSSSPYWNWLSTLPSSSSREGGKLGVASQTE